MNDRLAPPKSEVVRAWAIPEYGAAESLALSERPLAIPGPGELLVEVEAVALNPLDLKIIGGQMKDVMPAEMPYVPGSDFVGVVSTAGDGAAVRAGDRVVISAWNGGLASHVLVPASAHVALAPATASAVDLAALPMAGLTARHILRMLGDVAGRTIAVIGATGGVGLMLVQLASQAGALVIGTGQGPEDDALLRANGAADVIDYARHDIPMALRARYPGGADIVIDLVTMFDALFASANAVKDGGTLLSTLFGPEPAAFGDRINFAYVRLKAQPGDLDQLVRAYTGGALSANVSRVFSFDQAVEAYRALRDEHVRGKIVVRL